MNYIQKVEISMGIFLVLLCDRPVNTAMENVVYAHKNLFFFVVVGR